MKNESCDIFNLVYNDFSKGRNLADSTGQILNSLPPVYRMAILSRVLDFMNWGK